MGKCSVCKKKILYNKYKMYRGKILCMECYSTRLERKAAKIAERKRQAESVKIVKPSKKARKNAKDLRDEIIPDIYGGDNEPEPEAKDSD